MTDTTTAMLAMLPGAPGEAQLLGAISRLPVGAYITAPAKRETAGYRLQGPVAVIQIFGALAHHTGWMWSYQDIAGWLNDALKNPAVKAIVLSIDSPGGMADGCAQLGNRLSPPAASSRSTRASTIWRHRPATGSPAPPKNIRHQNQPRRLHRRARHAYRHVEDAGRHRLQGH